MKNLPGGTLPLTKKSFLHIKRNFIDEFDIQLYNIIELSTMSYQFHTLHLQKVPDSDSFTHVSYQVVRPAVTVVDTSISCLH